MSIKRIDEIHVSEIEEVADDFGFFHDDWYDWFDERFLRFHVMYFERFDQMVEVFHYQMKQVHREMFG